MHLQGNIAAPDHGASAPPAKPRKLGGREPGFNQLAVQARRRERVREAVALRVQGFTYRRIAERLQVNLRTATMWAKEGLTFSVIEAGAELERLVAAFRSGEPQPRLVDDILAAQARLMQLHRLAVGGTRIESTNSDGGSERVG